MNSIYQDDFDSDLLEVQLLTFGVNIHHDTTPIMTLHLMSIFDIRDHFNALSATQRSLLSQVGWVLQLILVMPATSASERSFNTLPQVETYLRSTMGQQRLNKLMLPHVHSELLILIVNESVMESEHRLRLFSAF